MIELHNCPDHYKLPFVFQTPQGERPLEVEDLCEYLFDDDPRLYQAMEYLCRCKKKGQYEGDLMKARYYIDKALERLP